MKLQTHSYSERAQAHIRAKLKRRIRILGFDSNQLNRMETKELEHLLQILGKKGESN